MRSLVVPVLLSLSLLSAASLEATGPSTATYPRPEDVASPDAIVAALYEVISGPAGQPRDFDRMRSLFMPGAILVATAPRPDGTVGHRTMSVDDYIASNGPGLTASGFTEREIGRTSERFGTIMHTFSAYEGTFTHDDGRPGSVRGINTIQLFGDGTRWWIVSVLWQPEDAEKIPKRYLGKS